MRLQRRGSLDLPGRMRRTRISSLVVLRGLYLYLEAEEGFPNNMIMNECVYEYVPKFKN